MRYAGLTAGAVTATAVQNALLSKVEVLQANPILKNISTAALGVGLGMAASRVKALKKNAALVEAVGDGMYTISTHNMAVKFLQDSVPTVAKAMGIAGPGNAEFIVSGPGDDLLSDPSGLAGIVDENMGSGTI